MGFVQSPYTETALRSILGPEIASAALRGLQALANEGITDRGVVAWLEAVEAVRSETPRPSLVWTGPEVPGLHARDTREVIDELISRAEQSLWISTYAYFDGKKVFDHLAMRLEAKPNLSVFLILNIHFDMDRPDRDSAVSRARDRLWKHNWPGSVRPAVYYFPESLVGSNHERAVLHAKAIVRDEKEVLVTSANFTDAALSRNIELGVLLHDAALARTVVRHYERLIEAGRLVQF